MIYVNLQAITTPHLPLSWPGFLPRPRERIFLLVVVCSPKYPSKILKRRLDTRIFANGNSLFPSFRCGKIILFLVTAEIGDFEESKCRSHLLNNNYIPDQMPLIDKIMEFHSRHMWVSCSPLKLEKGFYFIQAYFFFPFIEAENPFSP